MCFGQSGKRRRQTRVVERLGISPALVPRLLDSTVFLTLEDLGFELPSYRRGFNLDKTCIWKPERVNRLIFAVAIAYILPFSWAWS